MHRPSRFASAFGLVAVLTTGTATAVPLPTGTTRDVDLIVDFDFTRATPPPPYTTLGIAFALADSAGHEVAVDLFGGPGGADYRSSFFYTSATSGTLTGSGSGFAPLLDGVFSLGFRVDAGNVQLLSVSATEFTGNRSVTIDGVPFASVPEPASVALLAAGAIVSILTRRRRAMAGVEPGSSFTTR